MFLISQCQQLNEIDDEDYIAIIASLKYQLEKSYDCNNPNSYIRNGKMPDQVRIDTARKIRGCYSEIKDPTYFPRHSNIVFKRCVCNFYDYNINSLIELNEYYKINKTLPPDYIYERDRISNKLLISLRIVNNFIEEKRAEEIKRQTEAAKKQGIKSGRR